jgi:hypothetical protein
VAPIPVHKRFVIVEMKQGPSRSIAGLMPKNQTIAWVKSARSNTLSVLYTCLDVTSRKDRIS